MKKRILSLAIVVILFVGTVPIGALSTNAATTITIAQFNSKLGEFKSKVYKQGSTYEDSKANVSAYGGYQCFGFANCMAKYFYGSYPTNSSSAATVNSNWSISRGASAINNLHVGDIVRFRINSTTAHSIFVTGINGETVYYADANSDWKNTVKYTGSKTKKELKALTDALIPYTSLKGWVAHYKYWTDINTLTINYAVNGGTIAQTNRYKVSTTNSTLTLRASASTSSTALVAIPDGTELAITETKTEGGYTWGKTRYNGKIGWCALDYTVRQGYYTTSGKIYQYSNSALASTVWNYGTGSSSGLCNAETFGLSRSGYKFSGWCLKADGSSRIFNQDDATLKAETIDPSVSSASKTITLYAIWTPTTTHTFSFESNGGTGLLSPISAKMGDLVTIPKSTYTKENNSFLGWNVKRNNDNKWYVEGYGWNTEAQISANGYTKKLYKDNSSFTVDNDWFTGSSSDTTNTYTFYALWKDTSIESIALSSIPAKTIYSVGDSIDTSKITVVVKNTDGSYETATSGVFCSPVTLLSEGAQTVTVSYKSHTTTFQVQVTKVKSISITAKANKDNTCYYLPSTSSAVPLNYAAAKDDTCIILCKEGNFYLSFFPFGESSATTSNGFLGYMDASTFGSPTAAVPDYKSYYTMNPTLQNNAKANSSAKIYHRPSTTSIIASSGTNYTSYESLSSGQAVRVLFELNGYYCIRTLKSVGFVIKSAITLDPVLVGISAESNGNVAAIVGGKLDTNSFSIKALYSDNTQKVISDYSLIQPSTSTEGQSTAVISYGGYTTFIPVTVKSPAVTGIEINSLPTKTNYCTMEEFNSDGLSLNVNYINGTSKTVDSNFKTSYDFTTDGVKEVSISYEGFTVKISVSVYAPAVLEICSSAGYEGQTVNIPISLSSSINALSFNGTISYDNDNLEYVGFAAGEGLDASKIQVSSSEDILNVMGTSNTPIDNVFLTLSFKIIGTAVGVETENQYQLKATHFEIYDNQNTAYNVINYSGYVYNAGIKSAIVTITGLPQYGYIVEAAVTGIPSTTGDLYYQWMLDGVEVGEVSTKNTYTIYKAVLGKKLSVRVTSANGLIDITSYPVLLKKNSQSSPSAPIVESKTDSTVTLVSINNCEYSSDGFTWQSSNYFTDLQPNKEYMFYVRFTETETAYASDKSEGLAVATTKRAVKGDINNDNDITIVDAIIAFQYLSGKSTISDKKAVDIFDIDLNGIVSIVDVIKIFYVVAGKITIADIQSN